MYFIKPHCMFFLINLKHISLHPSQYMPTQALRQAQDGPWDGTQHYTLSHGTAFGAALTLGWGFWGNFNHGGEIRELLVHLLAAVGAIGSLA
jgi:hypothetical protein